MPTSWQFPSICCSRLGQATLGPQHQFEDHEITPVSTEGLSGFVGIAVSPSTLCLSVYTAFQTASTTMLILESCFFKEISGLRPRLHRLNSDLDLELRTTAVPGLQRNSRYHNPGQDSQVDPESNLLGMTKSPSLQQLHPSQFRTTFYS